LIHQACIKRGWLSEEEFVRMWALAQISPGINLLKLTVLLGYKLRGWPGMFSASAGLMLPSGGATILMTAGFSLIRGQPVVQAAMKGILPATIGLSLAMAVQMGQPLLSRGYREGRQRFVVHLLVAVISALLLGLNLASPVVILLAAGGATVLLLMIIPERVQSAPEKSVQ
jgi:chromate transporter